MDVGGQPRGPAILFERQVNQEGERADMRPLLSYRRYQFVGAMLFAVALPTVFGLFKTRELLEIGGVWTTIGAVSCAVIVGFAIWRRFYRMPSVQNALYVLWAFLPGYLLIMAAIIGFRLEYNRFLFVSSLSMCVIWFGILQFLLNRWLRPVFAVVEGGGVDSIIQLPGVAWKIIQNPNDIYGVAPGSQNSNTNEAGTKLAENYTGVVADLRHNHPPHWERFFANATLEGIPVYHHKQLAEELSGQVNIEHLSENVFGSLLPDSNYLKLKRLADLLLCVIVAPLIVPLLIIVAIAIAVFDGRPVFFRQHRIGFRGKTFIAYKFRSMVSDGEHGIVATPAMAAGPVEIASPVPIPGFSDSMQAAYRPDLDGPQSETGLSEVTQANDPRITKLGNFLRKSRLDELPQIINIVRGEMSWIGPRPEARKLANIYEEKLPFYSYRHAVRPGISGWAQVRQGHVTSISDVNEKLKYDFYYIKHLSPWLDILIVLKTIKTIATGFGAK